MKTENFNFWEKQAIHANKTQLVINECLPKDVIFTAPQQDVAKASLEKKVVDNTITKNEKCLKVVLILFAVLIMFILFWLMNTTPGKRRSPSFQENGMGDLTKVKSTTITDADIESTMSFGQAKVKKESVKIGDRVSYNEDSENVAYDQKRNFNTPLLIQAQNSGSAFGGGLRSPSLPIAPNSYVRVYLENEINSQNFDIPITALTYMDLTNNGHLIIPKESKLIGVAERPRNGSRVSILFETAIFPNGKEYSINGVALGDDNATGVAANVDYKLAKKSSALVASSLLSAASSTLLATGGSSFGSAFAGDMAGNASSSIGDGIDYESQNNGMALTIPENTRFKVLFE